MITKARDFDFTCLAPGFTQDSQWGKCLTSFLNQILRKSGSTHTQHRYSATLQQFFGLFPRKMPYLYTREDVESFISTPSTASGREGQPVKAGTQNNKLSILSSFYRFAGSYGVQSEDGMMYPLFKYLSPTAGMHFGQCPQSGQKFLSDDELRRFFAAIGTEGLRASRDRALFLALFWTARRITEITGLRWRDLSQELIMDGQSSRLDLSVFWKRPQADRRRW
jgi:site-specific recombinase XerD